MVDDPEPDLPKGPTARPVGAPKDSPGDQAPDAIRTGERFDGGTDEDEKAGAGFGEGDDAKRLRRSQGLPEPD